MINETLKETEEKMKSTVHVLQQDLLGIRTGRASTSLLEKITVEYYGTQTPLNQLAGLSVPDSKTITINPYDRNAMSDIERAILNSDLGLNPNNDGSVIRLNIPPLTKDRRKELVKVVNKQLEESRVSVRNIRRSAIDDLRKAEKKSEISEDELHNAEETVQKLTDKYIDEIDAVGKRKEAEIMEV